MLCSHLPHLHPQGQIGPGDLNWVAVLPYSMASLHTAQEVLGSQAVEAVPTSPAPDICWAREFLVSQPQNSVLPFHI